MDTEEKKPLLSSSDGTGIQNSYDGDSGIQSADKIETMAMKLYKRRWYILLLYSLFAGTQGAVWNTWGPISASSEDAFGWANSDISLLANWGPISYVVGSFFFSWMLEVKGLRWASVSSMFLVALGCGLRCITTTPPAVTWLTNVGQFFNGLAGPIAMGGPPVVSSAWFAPNERTTSTALAFSITNGLMALSYIIGPLAVPNNYPNCTRNVSLDIYSPEKTFFTFSLDEVQFDAGQNCTNTSVAERIAQERKDIIYLMYMEFGWSILILLAMFVYFPKKPPLPPCTTASIPREGFFAGLKLLLKKHQFWLVCVVYGIAIGVLNCWASVLDVNLKDHGISEKDAGWIGFYGTLSGCTFALLMARFADVFSKHMKWMILLQYTVGMGFFLWVALMCFGIAPTTKDLVYATIICGMTVMTSSVPLLFELSCELTYPIGEATTNGVLTLINNIGGLFFLLVMMIPNIGTQWMNWAQVGCIGACLPVLLLLRESYRRLEVDEITVYVDPDDTG